MYFLDSLDRIWLGFHSLFVIKNWQKSLIGARKVCS